MSISNYILSVIIFLFVIIILGILIYYQYIKPKYTRERFAFVAMATFTTFLVSTISLLLAPNSAIEWFIQVINQWVKPPLPPYQPNDSLLNLAYLMFASGLLYLLINRLYSGWDGLKSTRQVDKEDTKSKLSLYEDFFYYLKNKTEIEIYKANKFNDKDVFSIVEPDTRPWRIKAVQLLKLYDQQYDIDEEKDWHRECHAYIGKYGDAGKKIGILCFEQKPTMDEIRAYIRNIQINEFKLHIIAVAQKGEKCSKTHQNIEFKFRYENELLDSLISFSDYKRHIINNFDKETLPNSELTQANIYVPLGGVTKSIVQDKLKTENNIDNVEEYILDWVNTGADKEHLVILGDYGQGKTVLTKKIVKEMLENPEKYDRIPILIELRGISPRTDDIEAILGRWANCYRCKAQALLELHKAGRLLIILDGFDEMDLVADNELLFNHFNQLWALAAMPKAKIIITGRPNLFIDDVERRNALGILPQRIDLPYSKAISLNSLSIPQIEQVLRHVQPNTKTEILHALHSTGERSSFRELLMRPSTLYQLSTVWDSELANYKNRLNSAVVIGKFIDKTYERQEAGSKNKVLTTHERNYFMVGIAVGMMLKNQYTNQIKANDLLDIIRHLWDNYPPNLPPYKDAQQGSKVKDFLPNRLRTNQKALEVVKRDVLAGGILVQDLSGRDIFKFAHKSFMEYLVSTFYSGFLLKKETDKARLMVNNSVAQTFNFKQTQLAPSRDVERFVAEQVVADIELVDKQGTKLPIEGNEIRYQKAIFKKVNPYWYGRLFPNLIGWCSLHPAQKYLIWIMVASIFCFISIYITENELLRNTLRYIAFVLIMLIYLILYKLKLFFTVLQQSDVLQASSYNSYMRLYVECSNLLHLHLSPLKKYYAEVIYIVDNKVYLIAMQTIKILLLPIFLLLIYLIIPIMGSSFLGGGEVFVIAALLNSLITIILEKERNNISSRIGNIGNIVTDTLIIHTLVLPLVILYGYSFLSKVAISDSVMSKFLVSILCVFILLLNILITILPLIKSLNELDEISQEREVLEEKNI